MYLKKNHLHFSASFDHQSALNSNDLTNLIFSNQLNNFNPTSLPVTQAAFQNVHTFSTIRSFPVISPSPVLSEPRLGYLPAAEPIPDKTYIPAVVPDKTYLPVVPDKTYLPVKKPTNTYLPVPDKTYLPVQKPTNTYLPSEPDTNYLPSIPSNTFLPDNRNPQPPNVSLDCLISCVGK